MIKELFGFGKKQARYGTQSHSAPDVQNSTTVASSDFIDWTTTGFRTAGVSVVEQTAMQVSAVYASVALIGGAIASMPLPVYQRGKSGNKKVDSDIYWLLNEEPNSNYPAAIFWEAMVGSLLLHGDAFAIIIRPNLGSDKILGFEWVHSRRVTVKKHEGHLIYVIQDDMLSGGSGKSTTYLSNDIIHIPGPGFNGLRGMSQIRYVLRNAAGISLAADQYSAAFFENGARPDFALEFPGNLTIEQQDMIRASWANRHNGVGNAHLPALMAGGAKVHELTMNAEDSQLIATREFQIEDVARIFGVPPHMIGHTQNNTSWGSGIESLGIGFVKYTLARHLAKIEQELNRKVWPTSKSYFVKFNTAGLERGDYTNRMEGYRVGLGRAGEAGWLSLNEIRELEDLPPIKGGDEINKGITNEPTTPKTPSA